MKIGYFAPMSGLKAGGPETYDTCLARGLAGIDASNDYTIYCTTPNAVNSFAVQQSNFRYKTLTPSSRWISIPLSLPLELIRKPVDLFHATYVPPPFFPGKLIFTLLDLSPFSNPELYPPAIRMRLQFLLKTAVKRAQWVVSISEFSKQCLLERFGFPEERAVVTHLGVDPRCKVIEDRELVKHKLAHYGVTGPYAVYIGRLQARKNINRLLEAFHRAKQDGKIPHKLVFVGRRSWEANEIFETVKRLNLEEHLIHTDYVPADDLVYFYNGADALLYPSIFEGFGIPVIEAMACGTPVLTSNTTSLPEVAGNAAVLVDPLSVDAIADGIHDILTDETLRGRLRRDGLERASEFSWQKTAEKTLQVYKRAVLQ